ncbi:MAG: hypothetical protein CSB33_04230 [Desulfobacterales bacterium]|nr:MAG: hypothetical protein CSB33_04230 [Desulfobacterales bacterium]
MAKVFRPSTRESSILSRIESSKEHERRKAINDANNRIEEVSNRVAMKLVENQLVETTNKNGLEAQIRNAIDFMMHADDFDMDYKIAPFRNLAPNPNIVALYLTAFVIETVINHKDTIDVYGSDEEIYACILQQVLHRPAAEDEESA